MKTKDTFGAHAIRSISHLANYEAQCKKWKFIAQVVISYCAEDVGKIIKEKRVISVISNYHRLVKCARTVMQS